MKTAALTLLTAFMAITLMAQTPQRRHQFEVIDQNGKTVVVVDGYVSYAAGSFSEYSGIWVRQPSDGRAKFSWAMVRRLEITDAERWKAEVTLVDGMRVAVILEPGNLHGRTLAGEFEIVLNQLQTIIPFSGRGM